MKTITQMRSDIDYFMKQLGDMKAKCEQENRMPAPEERSMAEELLNKVDELEEQIKLEQRSQETLERLAKPTRTPDRIDPKEERTKQAKKDSFASFGEQMAAVMRASMPGGSVDPRLYQTRAATGLNESVGSDGGFLVQQDFAAGLIKNVFATGRLASKCRRITVSGNSNSIKINGIDESSRANGSRWGGIRGYWVDEAGEKTASKPKFRKIELNLHKLIGLCYATDELLSDVGAMSNILREGFISEFGFMLDDAIINGSGVGQPLGVLSSGALVTQNKETGQAGSTLVFENIINMWSRLFPDSQQNAVWLVNQNVTPQLYAMSLAVGTGGGPVYMPPGGVSASPYATLMGRPVMPIEQCQTLGTKGDIYLADFQNGYILADKGGISSDMSIHVRFVYDESVKSPVFSDSYISENQKAA